MKKRIKRIWNSNDGNAAYLLGIFFLLLLLGVCSAVIVFTQNMITVGNVKETAQDVLDNVASQIAADEYNSIKNGTDYTQEISQREYIRALEQELRLDNQQSCYYENGTLKYQLESVQLTFLEQPRLQLQAKVRLNIPLYAFGVPVGAIDGDFTVQSYFTPK